MFSYKANAIIKYFHGSYQNYFHFIALYNQLQFILYPTKKRPADFGDDLFLAVGCVQRVEQRVQ